MHQTALEILENPQAHAPETVSNAAWHFLNTDPLYNGVSPWHLREVRRYAMQVTSYFRHRDASPRT